MHFSASCEAGPYKTLGALTKTFGVQKAHGSSRFWKDFRRPVQNLGVNLTETSPASDCRQAETVVLALDWPSLRFLIVSRFLALRIRMFREKERGSSRTRMLMTLAFVGICIFLGVKIIPVLVNNYQLVDSMKEEARYAGVNRRDPESIRDDMYKKIQELDIPAKREDVHVQMIGPSMFQISLDYTVVVDLRVYQLSLNFHPQADSNSI